MPIEVPQDVLDSVGYKQQPINVPQELLDSVGYKPMQQAQQKQSAGVGDTLMAGATGFLGESSDLVGGAVRNIGTVLGSSTLQNIGQDTVDNGKKLTAASQDASSTASSVGKIGADALGILAGGSTLPGAIGSSALAGVAMAPEDSNPVQILMEGAKGAALSASMAGALTLGTKLVKAGISKAAPLVQNIVKGTSIIPLKADDYATAALDNTLKATGGDLTKANPDTVVKSISDYQSSLKQTSTDLYNLRDVAANNAGIKVSKSNVSAKAAELEADISTGATEGTRQGLAAAKSIMGSVDAPIPFTKAQSLMSSLSESAADAASQGNGQLSRQISSVRDALGKDIETAAASHPDVMQLHQAATDFYRESYSPIKGLDMQRQIASKVTNDQFVANLVKSVGKKQSATDGFVELPSEIKQQVLGAHQQALAVAASPRGEMDLAKYASALDASMKQNPALYKLTDSLTQMQTLANVIGAKAKVSMGSAKLLDSALIGGGFAASVGTMNPGFLAAAAIPVAQHLYAAGKMLNNPSAQKLLNTVKGLDAYPEAALTKQAKDKVSKLYYNQFRNLSSKAAGIIGVQQ